MLSESKIRWLWSEAHNDTSDRMAYQVLAEMVEAEVRKQDDALILQMLEALERAKKHHFTTSLPLVIENYGSKIKCANEGSIVWRGLVPSAITAGRARLAPSTEPASNSTRTTDDRL